MPRNKTTKIQVYLPPEIAEMFERYYQENCNWLSRSQAGLLLFNKALRREFSNEEK